MPKKETETLESSLSEFLARWHVLFIDWWWREKYKIPFGSPAHRAQNHIDMAIEYLESLKVQRIIDRKRKAKDDELKVGTEDENVVEMSPEEIRDDFENLDLSKF